VLDGGWAAWVRAGGDIETGDRVVTPGDFQPLPGALPVVEADEVLDVPVLVDARAPERYRGETEPVDPEAGHIPGAVNVPSAANLRPDGTFRPVDELRATYAAVGVTDDLDVGQVAVYCGSGVTAIHDLIALELLGVRGALYPGSWSGWITDPDRPRASG
jgi:thiosulfate/3-mercaptopyruvate sulfurtransferase